MSKGHGHGGGGGHGEGVNLERWLVSYADFMTLLFCVFVMLYALSMAEEASVAEVAASIMSALGVTGIPTSGGLIAGAPDILQNSGNTISLGIRTSSEDSYRKRVKRNMIRARTLLLSKIQELPPSKQLGGELDVEIVSGVGLVIHLPTDLAFKPGEAALRPQALPTLEQVSEVLESFSNRVAIEGHTADTEVALGKFPSNWELSAAQASSVLKQLLEKPTLKAERFSMGGYGEYHPAERNDSDANRAKNRRVDIIVQEPKYTP